MRDLLDQGVPGEVIRFVMLSTHYRKPMDWTEAKRQDAEKTLRKWYAQVAQSEDGAILPDVITALSDDVNTAGALAALHAASAKNNAQDLRASLVFLGLLHENIPEWAMAKNVDLSRYEVALATARDAAMQTKDFSQVDALKAMLIAAGAEVRMSKEGVELIAGADFDATKLTIIKEQ